MWSSLRKNKGIFLPEDVDTSLCSHLMYSFARVEFINRKLEIVPYEDDLELTEPNGLYPRIINLKNKNPNLKIILSISSNIH
jgi:chitinase